MAETGILPETAAPSPGAFEQAFRKLGAGGDEVVCINLSAALSATMQSAATAAKSLEGEITVTGPLGSLSRRYGAGVTIEKSGDTLVLKAASPENRAMHGTWRALVAGMGKGVTDGLQKRLALVGGGDGARAAGE